MTRGRKLARPIVRDLSYYTHRQPSRPFFRLDYGNAKLRLLAMLPILNKLRKIMTLRFIRVARRLHQCGTADQP